MRGPGPPSHLVLGSLPFRTERAARLEIRGDFRNDLHKTVGLDGEDTEIMEEACYAPTLRQAKSA